MWPSRWGSGPRVTEGGDVTGKKPVIRLELMAEPVAVVVDGDRVQVKRPASGHLLRLMFWANRPIDLDAPLAKLGEAGVSIGAGRDTFVKDARDALRDIDRSRKTRLVIAADAAGRQHKPARFLLRSSEWDVDALDFLPGAEDAQAAISGFKDDLRSAPEKVPSDFGNNLELWLEAYRLWGANPGVDLEGIGEAKAKYDEYEALYQDLVAALVVAYAARFLEGGKQHDLTLALNYFDPLRSVDIAIWELGFRVAASMDGWKVKVESLKARIHESTGETLGELAAVIEAAERRDSDFLLVPSVGGPAVDPLGVPAAPRAGAVVRDEPLHDVHEPVPVDILRTLPLGGAEADSHGLLQAAALLGIADYSALDLESSNVTPVQCCRDVVRTLRFSGIMANKWVLRKDAFEAFDELLTDLDRHGEAGLVRLMIVDPDGDAAPVLRRRGLLTDREMESLPVLKDLLRRHQSFQVRMYDTMPVFRLIIVDNTYVTVAPYLNLAKALPRSGWEVPQLALTPNAPFPFAQAFMTFFDEAWSRSKKHLTDR